MLPFHVQVLIIERLPIKSLLRFRLVCKAWKSFISSSKFIAFHHAHSQQHHLIISYINIDHQLKYVSVFDNDQSAALTIPPLVQGIRVLDSSLGLLCLIDSFNRHSQTQMAVLWNPAIRRSVAVSVPNVIDPQQFCSVVGFGVCPATMDPKLVKITFINDEEKIQSISCIPFQVMVFTLSSGQWRCLSTNHLPRKSIQFFEDCHTVIGQFIYLVGLDWSALDGECRTLIMSFGLTTHEFREVDIPNSLRHSYDMSISRLRESLVLLEYDESNPNLKQVCHVWMMMDDGDSKAFTKLFTINPPNAHVGWTLGFRESGEPIIESTSDEMDGSSAVGVYEPGLGDIKDLGIRGRQFYGSSYTESLLLLDRHDGPTLYISVFGFPLSLMLQLNS